MSLVLRTSLLLTFVVSLACGDEGGAGPELVSPWSDLAVGRELPTHGTCVGSDAAPPATLSAHPCFTGSPPAPMSDLVFYAPGSPLWSDHAEKERYVALPAGTQMTPTRSGDLEFPPGAVLVKRFFSSGRPIEDRIMELDASGTWHYATYVWNDDATDATLSEGEVVTFGETDWAIPTHDECVACHAPAAGESLGLEIPQLNGVVTYPSSGREGHQLATLAALGMLDVDGLEHPDELRAYTADDARGYLASNCGNCHRPGGVGAGRLDLRGEVELRYTNLCDQEPEYGDPIEGGGGRIVVPGNPDDSILLWRMRSTSSLWRMPTVGSGIVDERGTALIESWIRDLESCE